LNKKISKTKYIFRAYRKLKKLLEKKSEEIYFENNSKNIYK